MAGGKSSFHMSNEFNGYGDTTYLKGTQRRTYAPLSQDNVHLTRDFSSLAAKMLGGIPLIMNAQAQNANLIAIAVAGMPVLNRVFVTKNNIAGMYSFDIHVSSSTEFTNGAYLQSMNNQNTSVLIPVMIQGGWEEQENRQWKYIDNSGKYVCGDWIEYKEKWYYLDTQGYMVVGWKEIKGKWYHFKSLMIEKKETTGYMQMGWVEIKRKWYYLKQEADAGYMVTGWRNIAGKWYYFKTKEESRQTDGYGYMVTGWRKIKEKWYFFDPNSGDMVASQMIEWNGESYYFDENGCMVISRKVNWEGKVYWADDSGVCKEEKAQNTNSVDVTRLHPRLQKLQADLIKECDKKGYKIKITEGIRTVERQNELYAQGRTKDGPKVTNAQGTDYSSHHQWGTAFDFCRNDGTGAFNDNDQFFSKVGAIGKALGLEWGGNWTSPVDKPHFQLPDWGSTTKKIKTTYANPAKFESTW